MYKSLDSVDVGVCFDLSSVFASSTFNHISLTRLLSTHRKQLRSGNGHALKETLRQSLRGQGKDEASQWGGVVGDAEPQLQVACVNC